MYQILIKKAKKGFKDLVSSENFKDSAIKHISIWLNNDMFRMYVPHIIHLINKKKWKILLDSFYKTISFGTGGRRGLIGIGPNRINICTIRASAQGYSQYLIKKFGDVVFYRGIVLAYDARKNIINGISSMNTNIEKSISSFQLAKSSAEVYALNGIKVYLFNFARSTPELSFSIRYLGAVGGCMFTASHNLPQYNGEKFYDFNGSQFIPPYDEYISVEIDNFRNKMQNIEDKSTGSIIKQIDDELDKAYYKSVKSVTLNNNRKIKILYSPLHGTGITSVYPILSQLGFEIYLDRKTSNLSGNFENIVLNVPNPEFRQSFDNLLSNANLHNVDIIMNTDSDADRLGVMVRDNDKWKFLNGNKIGIILTEYILKNTDCSEYVNNKPIIAKTWVTSSLINEIAIRNNAKCIGDLLVGFKYISNEINKLSTKGLKNTFLLGIEESHGYLVGPYCRDKDAAGAAILIAELAAMLKKDNLTLVDYINDIYSKYGYCHNHSTEINLYGTDGIKQIDNIMNYFRTNETTKIGGLNVKQKIDCWKGEPSPHLSVTDTSSRNMITFMIENLCTKHLNKLTIRPSGTESKLKIYIEIFGLPLTACNATNTKKRSKSIIKKIEIDFIGKCHNIMNKYKIM